MDPFKFSQLHLRIPFETARRIKGRTYHFGQLKLFYSELLFLSKHPDAKRVVYVGAAEGHHIGPLADLFPDMSFDLYDSRQFVVEATDKITLYNRYFTDQDAKGYIGQDVLFICDIRQLEFGTYRSSGAMEMMDAIVTEDMRMQETWVRIIKPTASLLKFRLPYEQGVQFQYLAGTLYLQPYGKQSGEMRLHITQISTKTYVIAEINEKMAYFNYITRPRYRNNLVCTPFKPIWDNCYAFYICKYYNSQMKSTRSSRDACRLMRDVWRAHYHWFPSKLDRLLLPLTDQKNSTVDV